MSISPETLSAIDATPAVVATPNRRVVLGRTTALLAAGALTVSGCSWFGGGEGSDDPEGLSIHESEIAALCDSDPFALDAYKEVVGQGPAADNEAARADTPLDADIKMEAVTDMGKGNAFLASLYTASENQNSASYNPQSLLEETNRIFTENYDNPEQFRADCEAVALDLLNEGKGDIEDLKAEQLVAFTNEYEGKTLTGLEVFDDVATQDTVKVLGFRDDNGNMLAGIVVSNDERNGQWVMIDNREAAEVTDEDNETTASIAEDELDVTVSETETTTTTGPNGEVITVTTITGPDGETVTTATIPGPDGEPIPVDPETGEPVPTPTTPTAGTTPTGTTPTGTTPTGTTPTGTTPTGTTPGSTTPGSTTPGSTTPATTTPGSTTPSTTGAPTTTRPTTTSTPTTTTPPTTVRPTTTTSTTPPTTVRPTTTTSTVPATTTTAPVTTKPPIVCNPEIHDDC